MKKILIFSAGPAGRDIFLLINAINKIKKKWKVIGFVDDNKKFKKKKVEGLEVFSLKKKPIEKNLYAITGMMDPIVRKNIYVKEIKNDYLIPNLIHPNIEIPKCFKLGKGNIIFNHVHLSFEVAFGSFSVISNFCDIGHNLVSKDFLTVMPSVTIGGNCRVGSNTLIGSGVKIIQNINIGDNCKIGIGSSVTSDLSKNSNIINFQRKVINKND
jgi:sugar O-acyltransferase (sialic acid O-acetyltransferase NeuD family)